MNARRTDRPKHPIPRSKISHRYTNVSTHTPHHPHKYVTHSNLPLESAQKDKVHLGWRDRLRKTVADGVFNLNARIQTPHNQDSSHNSIFRTWACNDSQWAALPSGGEAGESRRWPAVAESAKCEHRRARNTKRGLRSVDAIETRKHKRKFLRRTARRIARHNIIHTLTYYPKGQEAFVSPSVDKSKGIGRDLNTHESKNIRDKRYKIRNAAKQAYMWERCVAK